MDHRRVRRDRRAAVALEGDGGDRQRRGRSAGDGAAVGRGVDVPLVVGRLLEIEAHRHVLALGVVHRQRGGVVVGVGVGEVDQRRRGRQRHRLARIEVHLHLGACRRIRVDAAGGQLQRHRLAGLDHAVAVGRVTHQPVQAVVDDVAVAVDLELAVARVGHRAAPVADLEEAGAVDGQVHRVLGGRRRCPA